MLLKNLMEDKQLDFDRPLLSVRRFTSQVASSKSEGNKKTDNSVNKVPRPPVYKSELKSGPIRNPGTVPFVWENTPGRPKEKNNVQARALYQPPIAPKLPPGRALNDKQQSSKQGADAKTCAPYQTEIVPSSSQNVSSLSLNETTYECTSGEMEETRSCGSKDSGEAYVDALDTLSRSESLFMNCSISGVSGLEGSDIRPSGIFSSDTQTRDFMMGRFLPAAKAVASETPPYATRKQPIAREPPRQVENLFIASKKHSPYVSSPNKFPHYAHDEVSEESDDDSYSQSQNGSVNVCGLVPQFLVKSSFCLLNPMPGMKIQSQKPVKPSYSVRRREANFSYLRSYNETENEHTEAAGGKGLTGYAQTEEVIEDIKNLKIGYGKKSCRNNYQNSEGASQLRHLQCSNVSSYDSYPSQNFQVVHQEKGFLGIPEKAKNYRVSSIDPLKNGSKNFQELLASDSMSQESGSASPVEKTLYVDSVQTRISSNSYFPDQTALNQCMKDDLQILVSPGEMEENPSVDSSFKDAKHLNFMADEKAAVQHKSMKPADPYSPEMYTPYLQMDATNGARRNQDLIQDSSTCLNVTDNEKDDTESLVNIKFSHQDLIQDSNAFTHSKVAGHRKVNSESHSQIKSSNQGCSRGINLALPLALPLPKAPSESWLKRTLPAVSSRNSSWSSLGTCSNTESHAYTAPSSDLKWETIVRSSNVHHGRSRFSEEQLPPIPEA